MALNPKVKGTMIDDFDIGHPIGATGCRLAMTLCKELRRSGERYGLITRCIGPVRA